MRKGGIERNGHVRMYYERKRKDKRGNRDVVVKNTFLQHVHNLANRPSLRNLFLTFAPANSSMSKKLIKTLVVCFMAKL